MRMTIAHQRSSLRTVAALFKQEVEEMFVQWGLSKPLRTGAPHVSAILQSDSEWCLRRQVLLALYPEEARPLEQKPWDAHQNAVFLHGWHLHEKYQRLFAEFGQIVEVECSHFDEVRFLHFTPDAVIFWAGQRYVVEIKGYKLDHFARLDEVGDPPEAAWHQCNLYMHVLGIERGLILVECKDTQELKVWCIEHDALLARPYMDRCYSVKGAVTTGHIPARICQSCQEHRAEKCPVRDFCFSGRIKENS